MSIKSIKGDLVGFGWYFIVENNGSKYPMMVFETFLKLKKITSHFFLNEIIWNEKIIKNIWKTIL